MTKKKRKEDDQTPLGSIVQTSFRRTITINDRVYGRQSHFNSCPENEQI